MNWPLSNPIFKCITIFKNFRTKHTEIFTKIKQLYKQIHSHRISTLEVACWIVEFIVKYFFSNKTRLSVQVVQDKNNKFFCAESQI